MKPLLPRVSSYLVPIQFPVNQSLVLQPSVKVPLPLAASLMSSELARHSKRVRIAPKVSVFCVWGEARINSKCWTYSLLNSVLSDPYKLINLAGHPSIKTQENAVARES